MKRVRKTVTAASTGTTTLELQYLSSDDYQNMLGVRPVTITRPSLMEALIDMLNNLYIPDSDLSHFCEAWEDEDIDFDEEEVIDRIQYINGDQRDADYILYLKNASTGEVYVDNNYKEEKW